MPEHCHACGQVIPRCPYCGDVIRGEPMRTPDRRTVHAICYAAVLERGMAPQYRRGQPTLFAAEGAGADDGAPDDGTGGA